MFNLSPELVLEHDCLRLNVWKETNERIGLVEFLGKVKLNPLV